MLAPVELWSNFYLHFLGQAFNLCRTRWWLFLCQGQSTYLFSWFIIDSIPFCWTFIQTPSQFKDRTIHHAYSSCFLVHGFVRTINLVLGLFIAINHSFSTIVAHPKTNFNPAPGFSFYCPVSLLRWMVLFLISFVLSISGSIFRFTCFIFLKKRFWWELKIIWLGDK